MTLSLNRLERAQLRAALNQASKGLWVSVQSDNDEFGILCNGKVIASKLNIADAYIVDAMHGHFSDLLNDVEILEASNANLEKTVEDQLIEIEALKIKADAWQTHYLAVKEMLDHANDADFKGCTDSPVC